ncbi:MAG: hypothetical protein NTV01_12255 [Bacteroidia bacterium]|nr:hypothetical protein [Bacteroidia bacterium]
MKKYLLLILGLMLVGSLSAQNKTKLSRADSFWGLHFDRHLGLTDSHIGATLTEGMIDSLLNMARPDYIQVDCKGHPGVSSYPTQVGQQAASYDKDPLALIRKVTNAHRAGLYVHYSGVKDLNYVRLHPEQARVQQNGKPDPENTSLWGDYSDKLLIPQLKEIALKYRVDGAWVDGEAWAVEPDFRPDVLAEFKKETGIEMTPEEPKNSKNYRQFLEFNRKKFISYLKYYTGEVHQAAPDFQICSNWAFSGMMPDAVPEVIGLNFFSGDYDPSNSLNIANWHARALSGQGIAFDLMAWSFAHDFAKGVSIPKTSIQLCQEAAPVISLGGGIQVYFRQNADISFQPAAFRIMKEVADFVIPRRDFCKGITIIPQVALLYSTAAWKDNVDIVYKSTGVSKIQGILNALLDGQSSVEVLMTHQLKKRLTEYPVVVIPEWKTIEPELEEMLKKYVSDGGNLLIIGASATAGFDELLGVQQKEAPVKMVRNICLGDRFAAVSEDVRAVECLAGTTELSKLFSSADLRFPAETAATVRSWGKGKVAGVYIDFGASYLINTSPVIRDLMAGIIQQLYPNPIIKIEGTHKVNVVPTAKNGKLLIQLVNTSGDHANSNVKGIDEIPVLTNLKVSVLTKTNPKSVQIQPEGTPLKYMTTVNKKMILPTCAA